MYFPWVGMLEQMRLADIFVHLDDAQFSKGGFSNRVQVKTKQGSQWLTVPLAKKRLGQAINEVQLSEHDWQRKHLATLKQAYAKAPYLQEMLSLVEAVFGSGAETLSELSASSMEAMATYLGLEKPKTIQWSSKLLVSGSGWPRVLEMCRSLGAERYVTGLGALKYLDHETFEKEGIPVEYMAYEKAPYPQLHGDFTPFVSGLDLIANCGRSGCEFIRSGTVHWKELVK